MKIVAVAGLVAILNGLSAWLLNLPRPAGDDVPEGKLNSISYAPYREDQSPLKEIFPSAGQIEEDMRLLAQKTRAIRIYASGEKSMPYIAPLAGKYGLEMIQGAWIGFLDSGSRLEIENLVTAANAYPDVIKRVMVGNEVLLRGEMEPEKLIGYIRAVKKRVRQPVSYADVWSMYMKYPELIREVDFITIHILPYWEDEPIPVEKAPEHIERIYRQVRREADAIAPGKPILIGEAGWPSAGKQRGWAEPAVVNEARFIRGLLKVARVNQFDVNIIEAFSQPWKSELEGVVGGNWGLYSADRRHEIFPLTGMVREHVDWPCELAAAAGLLLLAVLFYRKRLHSLPLPALILWLLFAQVLADVWVYLAHYDWNTSYSHWQRALAASVGVFNLILALLLLYRTFDLPDNRTAQALPAKIVWWLYLIVCGVAAIITFRLAVNGRYIDYPFSWAGVAVTGMIGLMAFKAVFHPASRRAWIDLTALIGYRSAKIAVNRSFGWLLTIMAAALVIGEIYAFMAGRDFILAYPDAAYRFYRAAVFTLTNQHLLMWLVCLGVLAMPLLSDEQGLRAKTD